MTDTPAGRDGGAGEDRSPPAGIVAPNGRHYAVSIRVNGQAIPLKAFLHDLIGGAVTGLLKGLHNVPDDPSEIEIEVRRR